MANMLTVIQVINDESAWDMIAIGSDFDEMYEPLDPYQTSEDLPQLAIDIQRFLERPESIHDLFTEEDIRELMFELSPAEMTTYVMNLHAYNFIRRNIANIHKED